MGDSTTAELVVEEVEEKEKSGDENPKKADAEKKLVKEKTKLTEKKGLKRSGEEQGGGDPKKCKKCSHLQESVDELEQRLQSEKIKSDIAHKEIVMLNKENIADKRQVEELTMRLKEMTKKFDGEKRETSGGIERYDPQGADPTKVSKNQLWELIRELDDEEMSDAIQESIYKSAAAAFTEIGFSTIQMIKRLTRSELQASDIPILVKNTMMRIVDRIGIGSEELNCNKIMPTDWHKIQVSIDLEG